MAAGRGGEGAAALTKSDPPKIAQEMWTMLPVHVLQEIAEHSQRILELVNSPRRTVGENLPDDVKARLGLL